MFSTFALILYLFLLAVFVSGVIVVIYHLLTFRLNRTLAFFMVTFLLLGAVLLVGLNLFYFSEVDWKTVFQELVI